MKRDRASVAPERAKTKPFLPEDGPGREELKMSRTETFRHKYNRNLQTLYFQRSGIFFKLFWFIAFTMTNFIFLFFTLHDFALDRGAWYATVIIFVFFLGLTYLIHQWYECLANVAVDDDLRIENGDGVSPAQNSAA